jgi:hypothetical protein
MRWAGGFLVDLPTFQDAQQLILEATHSQQKQQQSQQDKKQNQNKDKQDESSPLTLKAFRLGSKPVLQACIPWRSSMTPCVAHWLHWPRALAGLTAPPVTSTTPTNLSNASATTTASHGWLDPDVEELVACEIYVLGPNKAREHIDFVLVAADHIQ